MIMRMKELFVVALAIGLMVGCKKSDAIIPPTDDVITSETVEKEVGDNSRILSYRIKKNETRAAAYVMSAPTIPSDAISMVDQEYKSWEVENNTSYILRDGESLSAGINFASGADYYVEGDLTITDAYGSSGSIYILPGGTLRYEKTTLDGGHSIENYGELILPNNFIVNYGASLMTANIFNIDGSIEVNGSIYCEVGANVGSLTLNDQGEASFECSLNVENNITLNQGDLYINKYLKCDKLRLNDAVNFDFSGQALISCSTIIVNNSSSRINNIGDRYSVIECDLLTLNHQNQTQFNGWIDINAKVIDNRSEQEIQWLSGVVLDGNTYIPASECSPGYGSPTDTQRTYGLEHIAMVMPHSQNISATSIDFKGSNAFVSWHIVEAPIKGYIDVLDIQNLEVEATFTAGNRDFNHIYVSGDNIYSAGDNKRGAFVTNVNFLSDLGEIEIDTRRIRGASGNCLVITEDSTIWAVSGANGGVSIIDTVSSTRLIYHRLNHAKYIVDDGTKMLVLAGHNDTQIYNYSYDGAFIDSYSVGSISPDDGKNTIAVDGETVYVTLGVKGIKSFVNGVETMALSGDGAANCIAVDDKFVYVANGVNGFVILNKSDFSLVASHRLGGASANFVKKGADGLLYVAYGTKGVNVYNLVEFEEE